MSHQPLTTQRPMSPTSLNYVSANAFATSPRSPLHISESVERTGGSASKRLHLRTKAKKTVASVKKGLKTFASICRRENHGSNAEAFKTVHRAGSRLSMRPTQRDRTSTPSICLTRPTYRGSNVRLSVHQVPPSPVHEQGFEGDSPISGSGSGSGSGSNRKSMRFVHPVVNGVIASDGRKRTSSISVSIYSRDTSGEDREDQHATTQPGTPTTIATVDFEDQVNPKRVHKKLRVSASYNTFKDVMDGMKPMPVAAAPPTLPYIPLSSAMELEKNNESDSNDTTALAALAAKVQAEYILPATSKLPAVLLVPVTHPNTLTPGTAQPTAPPKPRTTAPRPHTTGNFLPYMAFSPDFDPYNATTAADTPAPSTYKGKGKGRAKDLTIKTPASSTSLSAAFAEADEAEARLAHKRHTVLYEEIEADFSVGPVPVIASSSSSSYFPSSSSNPPKQPKPQCQQKQIKRKAVPTALAAPAPAPAPAPAAAVRTSKPLPALPSPSSPRRFTQVVKPETLAMNENGYPFLGEASKQKQKPKTQQQESDEKQFKTTTTTKKARAVANADADANANAPDAAHKSRRAAGVRAVERALAKLML